MFINGIATERKRGCTGATLRMFIKDLNAGLYQVPQDPSDFDGDGVLNEFDICPATTTPELTVPSSGTLAINRYALTQRAAANNQGELRFSHRPARLTYTTTDTANLST